MTHTIPAVPNDKIFEVKHNFKTITIRWPRDSKVPTISGKWQRLPDGRIEATYTRAELEQCMMIFEVTQSADQTRSK